MLNVYDCIILLLLLFANAKQREIKNKTEILDISPWSRLGLFTVLTTANHLATSAKSLTKL